MVNIQRFRKILNSVIGISSSIIGIVTGIPVIAAWFTPTEEDIQSNTLKVEIVAKTDQQKNATSKETLPKQNTYVLPKNNADKKSEQTSNTYLPILSKADDGDSSIYLLLTLDTITGQARNVLWNSDTYYVQENTYIHGENNKLFFIKAVNTRQNSKHNKHIPLLANEVLLKKEKCIKDDSLNDRVYRKDTRLVNTTNQWLAVVACYGEPSGECQLMRFLYPNALNQIPLNIELSSPDYSLTYYKLPYDALSEEYLPLDKWYALKESLRWAFMLGQISVFFMFFMPCITLLVLEWYDVRNWRRAKDNVFKGMTIGFALKWCLGVFLVGAAIAIVINGVGLLFPKINLWF